jgi:ribose transport system substrate-binding protein
VKVMNRRMAFAVVISVCAVVAAACSSSGTSSSSAGAPNSASASSGTKVHTIVMVMAQLPSTFDGPIVKGAEYEAKQLGNITITAEGPNQQSATGQIPYLAAALATHPSALIMHPADPQALLGALQPYFTAKIPVITTLSTLDSSQVTASWIGNYVAEGEATALAMGKLMGGKGEVQLIMYDTTDPAGVNRVTGFKEEMKAKYPNIVILPPDVTGPVSVTAAAHSKADLIAHPQITGFYANGSIVGIGTIAGVGAEAAQGKIVIGTDGGDQALVNQMNAGLVQVLSCDDTYREGVAAVQALAALWAGKPYPKATNLNEDVTFTKSEDTSPAVTACISRAVA